MPAVFHIDIVRPDETLYSGDAVSAIMPGEEGYMGILAGHAPLFARLKDGRMTIKDPAGQEKTFDIKGKGFLEVLKNKVSVILV